MQLTLESLPQAVAQLLGEILEVKELLLETRNKEVARDVPLNIKQTSKRINKSVATIYKYCQSETIPYHKKGNRLFFFESELIEWIKQGEQNSSAENALLSNNKKALNYAG